VNETRKPVGADAYDEKWLAAAWGAQSNEDFLNQAVLHPRPRVERAMELAALSPGLRLLDIACGRGEVPALAAQAGVQAVGIDFSATSLEYANRLRQAHCDKFRGQMTLVRADACRLPFADASFDRITLLDIIEHLVPAQLAMMFLEVHRLLAPGGYAVIHTLPNRWVYDLTFPFLHRLWFKIPHDPRGPIDREVHVNEQDLRRLHRMLRRSGLDHRLWLEQQMPAQARWNRRNDHYGDNRDRIYPLLTGIAGRFLEIASLTPLKLLLANDIYGLAWKQLAPTVKVPSGLTERLACLFPGQEQE